MKKIYLSFTFFIVVASSIAEVPTLTAINNSPIIGESYESKNFTPAAGQEGSSGAGQTWDWSTIVEDFSATANFISPAGTAHAADHPSATVCLSIMDDIEYDHNDNTGLYMLGYYNPVLQFEQVLDNSIKFLAYPFTLNSTYTDSYHATITAPGTTGTQDGTITVTGDAWGTITTPAGVFTNVLRVHSHLVETFNFDTVVVHQTADQYSFYALNIHYEIASVSFGERDGVPFSGGVWTTDAVGINEVNAALYKLSVYPNPVTGRGSFSYTLTKSSTASWNVMDQTGRIVQKSGEEMLHPGIHSFEVDAANLPDGIYFIQAFIDNERASIKMIVNH